jgi:rhomboid protease GluP
MIEPAQPPVNGRTEPEQPAPRPEPAQIHVHWQLPARVPWVTYFFLASTILVYCAQWLTQTYLHVDWPAELGAKINILIQAGEVWRLATPLWLHVNLTHILFNMYALFILGPGLERQMGTWRFLFLYLVCGFAGNVASFVLTSATSVGASTAIFGLIGAQAIFLVQNRKILGKRANSLLINTIIVILVNLALGLMPGIDIWGHMGGLIAGLAFAWFAGPRLKAERIGEGIVISDGSDHRRFLWVGGILFVVFCCFSIIGFVK